MLSIQLFPATGDEKRCLACSVIFQATIHRPYYLLRVYVLDDTVKFYGAH